MQFRKMTLMLAALGAMSMVLTGCPDGGGEGRESLTCTADADCLDGEICHPGAKVCVQTCPSGNGSDCPDSAPTCEALSATNSVKICKCSTDQLCQNDERISDASTLACSTAYKVCMPTTGGTACDPNTQPGICGYGQICSSATSRCEAAPQGTCTQATGAPSWVQTGSSAPVIVSATAERLSTTNPTRQCGDGGPAGRVTIRFYAPGGLTTHTAFSDLQKHVRGKLNQSASFIGVSFSDQDPVPNATTGTMVVGFCGPSTAQGAIYIANEAGQTSNVVCVNW